MEQNNKRYQISFGRKTLHYTAAECLPRTAEELQRDYDELCVDNFICEWHEFNTFDEAKTYYDSADLEVQVDSHSHPYYRWSVEMIGAYLEEIILDEDGDVCDSNIIESRIDYDAYLRVIGK